MSEPDPDRYLEDLIATQPLREPVLREAVRILRVPPGSRGLDAGCGAGRPVLLLADAVGPEGHVSGIDASELFVRHARGIAARAGMSDRVSFEVGDLFRLPYEDGRFDWLWSVDCALYLAVDRPELIRELVRVVRPGGVVALLAWSSQMLLPGFPGLESRLNATRAGIAPFRGGSPETHFLRALEWLRGAGLEECRAHTLASGAQAPLSGEERRGIEALLRMRWEGARAEVAREDWERYRRLCSPDSPEFILRLEGYYAFFTYTMFVGRVPDPRGRADAPAPGRHGEEL